MRSLLLHLSVACLTFAVSSELTKAFRAKSPNPLPFEFRANRPAINTMPSEPVTSVGEVNLSDIYRDYAVAQTRHDEGFFQRVEDEDFRLFTSWGSYSRSEDIEIMKGESPDIVYKIEDLKIETKGEAAVVTGRMVSIDGGGNTHSWRWIDICVKRNDRWRIISTTQPD
jgi:FAD/FMN-containing dehydrogenase